MSRRTERIASVIRAVVGEAVLARLSDPRLEPITSVTRVEVSPDLSVARVNVSVMAETPQRRELSVRALRHSAGRLRALLAARLVVRQVPRLEFHLDESVRKSFETIRMIESVAPPAAPPAAAGDEPAQEPPQ